MSKVQAIPDGMHSLTPHLVCRGAAAAIDFYVRAFGAIERFRLPAPDGRLMHACVQIGDSLLFLFDEMPEHGALGPEALSRKRRAAPSFLDPHGGRAGRSPALGALEGSPVTIHLQVADADAVFARAVQAGATVAMPLAEQFWGDRYGQVVDPFGHRWSIATHVREVGREEMLAAMQAGR